MDKQMRIRSYPLVDWDAEGKRKKPMMSVDDEETAKRHQLYLQEFVLNSFRLCSTERGLSKLNESFTIACPRCSADLEKWTDGTKEHEHGLYVCRKCRG